MAFVGLSVLGELPTGDSQLPVLGREWGITAMRFFIIRHSVMPAGQGGKTKTALQALALGFFIAPLWTLPGRMLWMWVAWIIMAAAVILTLVTGIDISAQGAPTASRGTQRKRAERLARRRRAMTATGDAAPGPATDGAPAVTNELTVTNDLAARVIARARHTATTLGTRWRYLTGGGVATLTGVPSASTVVRGGIVSYATQVKASVLGVDSRLLAERGAVDPDVALAMARGARRVLGCALAVATTGVAGPDPADGKRVGTVFCCHCWPPG